MSFWYQAALNLIGLTQLYGFAIWHIALVRATGGLADTVTNEVQIESIKVRYCNRFLYSKKPEADDLRSAIQHAFALWQNNVFGRWCVIMPWHGTLVGKMRPLNIGQLYLSILNS